LRCPQRLTQRIEIVDRPAEGAMTGPTTNEASVTRPVTTTSDPALSAVAIPNAPR
jgi:hypothetical protein